MKEGCIPQVLAATTGSAAGDNAEGCACSAITAGASPGSQLTRKEASLAGLLGSANRYLDVSRCLILGGALSEYHRTMESSELEGTHKSC